MKEFGNIENSSTNNHFFFLKKIDNVICKNKPLDVIKNYSLSFPSSLLRGGLSAQRLKNMTHTHNKNSVTKKKKTFSIYRIKSPDIISSGIESTK